MPIFISYAHADQQILDRLLAHLKPITRGEDGIDVWSDRRLRTSQKWKAEIDAAISGADTAILIVSADFYKSDFIVNRELEPLLAKERASNCKIFCLLAKPSAFARDETLSQFQAMPTPDKTLAEYGAAKRDRILLTFCGEVADSLKVRISGGRAVEAAAAAADERPPIAAGKQPPKIHGKTIELTSFLKEHGTEVESLKVPGHTFRRIEGFEFSSCTILGPAVILPKAITMTDCEFVTDGEDLASLFYLSPITKLAFGVISVCESKFTNCTFKDIGFAGTQRFIESTLVAIGNKFNFSIIEETKDVR